MRRIKSRWKSHICNKVDVKNKPSVVLWVFVIDTATDKIIMMRIFSVTGIVWELSQGWSVSSQLLIFNIKNNSVCGGFRNGPSRLVRLTEPVAVGPGLTAARRQRGRGRTGRPKRIITFALWTLCQGQTVSIAVVYEHKGQSGVGP